LSQALERLQFDFQLSHKLSVSPWTTQLSRTWREYPCQVCPVYLAPWSRARLSQHSHQKAHSTKNCIILHLVSPPRPCTSRAGKWVVPFMVFQSLAYNHVSTMVSTKSFYKHKYSRNTVSGKHKDQHWFAAVAGCRRHPADWTGDTICQQSPPCPS